MTYQCVLCGGQRMFTSATEAERSVHPTCLKCLRPMRVAQPDKTAERVEIA